MATADTKLITAKQFWQLPDQGQPVELVRGKVVPANVPGVRHGEVCGNVYFELRMFLSEHDLGRAACNDSGVNTSSTPDTVRGADVCYYSYDRIPKDQSLPQGYADVAPEIVFEVLSPSDRWLQVLEKVAEYLGADVLVVCVVDPQRENITMYCADEPPQTLAGEQPLEFPKSLPGFSLSLERIF